MFVLFQCICTVSVYVYCFSVFVLFQCICTVSLYMYCCSVLYCFSVFVLFNCMCTVSICLYCFSVCTVSVYLYCFSVCTVSVYLYCFSVCTVSVLSADEVFRVVYIPRLLVSDYWFIYTKRQGQQFHFIPKLVMLTSIDGARPLG